MATTEELERSDPDDGDVGGPGPNWTRLDSISVAVITFLGGLLRFARVGDPPDLIFDEVYYAKDACWYLLSDPSLCDTPSEITGVHPPLGKWMLALGVRLFGYDSFGWRIAAVVAGTITIALLYLLARKLFRSTLGAIFASGLLAFDLLHFVQSRTAMLDIFVPLFGVAAFLFLAYDRERLLEHGPTGRGGLLERPWRMLAGLCGGAAAASKWSGAFVLVAVIVVTIVWEAKARRARGDERPWARAWGEEGISILVWLVLAPFVFYAITFIGRIEGTLFALPWTDDSWFRALWDRHVYMFDFHRELESTHGYQSPPWSWLLLKRPVSYFFESPDGNYDEIMATGSPFVWWSSILALLYVTYRWIRQRAFGRPEGLIIAGFAFTYFPWLLMGAFSPRSAVFIFYLLPSVPFMCLALAYIAVEIGRTWEARAARALFATATVGLFIFYYPVVAAVSIPQPHWDQRIWVFDDCSELAEFEKTETVTQTGPDGGATVTTTVTTATEGVPPKGWCWI